MGRAQEAEGKGDHQGVIAKRVMSRMFSNSETGPLNPIKPCNPQLTTPPPIVEGGVRLLEAFCRAHLKS